MNVLYDSTNHTRASRDRLREAADEVGAATKVITWMCPWRRYGSAGKRTGRVSERSVIDREARGDDDQLIEHPMKRENPLASTPSRPGGFKIPEIVKNPI